MRTASVLKQIDEDLKEETLLVHQPIDWTDVLREAEKLGADYNIRIGCRSADLFHVAAARELGCPQFLTFDDRQIALAEAAGLEVKP
jgi:predicted nucleic acid-binding protein